MRRKAVRLATLYRLHLTIAVIVAGLTVVFGAVSSSPLRNPSGAVDPSSVPLCTSDSECDDGDVCNGTNACVKGICVSGLPKACWLSGMRCDPTFGCFAPNPCSNNDDCPRGQCSVSGTCVLTAPCNVDGDCPNRQGCNSDTGKCVDKPFCNSDSDCPGGRICNSRQICVSACRTNADCDDHRVCNGLETCDGIKCVPGEPLRCDDNNPMTVDSCDYRGCTNVSPSRCKATGFTNPTFTAQRFPREIGTTGFTLRGSMNTPFRANSNIDPAKGRIRFTLVDAYSNVLVDEPVEAKAGGQWQFDGKNDIWTYSAADKKSGIQKLVITKDKKKLEEFDFEVQGRFANTNVPDLKALRPRAAIIVNWTGDITGPCSTVTIPECVPRNTSMGEFTFCRGDKNGFGGAP